MTRISVVGAGYVGLVTAACLADRGHTAVCVDKDAEKVDRINRCEPPIFENGLSELLQRTVGRSLSATTDLDSAVRNSDLTFIAVGTPAHDGRIDLRYVEDASAEAGRAIAGKGSYHTLIVKSTVIPGTTDGLVRRVVERESGLRAGVDFGLGMNPEFLTEGTAIADFMNPDRLVLGALDDRTHASLLELYESFAGVPRIITNNTTAEMIKYASNATLAAMISLANEFARICAATGGVDVADVTRGVHASAYFTTRHPDGSTMVAPITSFLEAGCGFGGSCLPKDVAALTSYGESLGLDMHMLRAVMKVNAGQPDEVLKMIRARHQDLAGVPVTVLGLAFKPDTDDMRESPAIPVIRRLREAGAAVTAYDPVARAEGHPELAGVTIAGTLSAALSNAEVVVIVTRWKEFTQVPELLAGMNRQPLLVDGRRMLQPTEYPAYAGIGR